MRKKKLEKIRFSSEEYAEYLRSEHWKNLRSQIYNRDSLCLICEEIRPENVHHLRYRNIYDVQLDDLIGVCGRCHFIIHCRVSNREELSLNAIKKRLKQPRVKLSEDLINRCKSSSVNRKRRLRGILKVTVLESCIGKSVSTKEVSKIIGVLGCPERSFTRSKPRKKPIPSAYLKWGEFHKS